jgi:type I restriction enzyme M protein
MLLVKDRTIAEADRPESGKKADLMFVQHMLSVLRSAGMVVTVMPHGVLFRGGEERQIRTGFLDEDILDTVIGLGSNLFYGTGIPACILVLRAPSTKPEERRGKVLFINADREYREGRAQNELLPEHIEKIVSAYEAFESIPGFASVVTREELRENNDNLNIRRFADNAPSPEPQDVWAHLHGGIPKSELEAKEGLFAAHGLDPTHLLVDRGDGYFDFVNAISSRSELKRVVEADEGVVAKERALGDAVATWWLEHQMGVSDLRKGKQLMQLRADLLSSFQDAVRPVGLLDRFQVAGVIASWWGETQNDLRTIATGGFVGAITAWESSIVSAIEDRESGEKAIKKLASKESPLDHRLVRRILPEFFDDISELQVRLGELESLVKPVSEADEDTDPDEDGDPDELSEDELKAARKDLTAIKRELKGLQKDFVVQLQMARSELDEASACVLVLGILEGELRAILGRYLTDRRELVVSAFETWWDKYRITLGTIEQDRDRANEKLRGSLVGLGYGV